MFTSPHCRHSLLSIIKLAAWELAVALLNCSSISNRFNPSHCFKSNRRRCKFETAPGGGNFLFILAAVLGTPGFSFTILVIVQKEEIFHKLTNSQYGVRSGLLVHFHRWCRPSKLQNYYLKLLLNIHKFSKAHHNFSIWQSFCLQESLHLCSQFALHTLWDFAQLKTDGCAKKLFHSETSRYITFCISNEN